MTPAAWADRRQTPYRPRARARRRCDCAAVLAVLALLALPVQGMAQERPLLSHTYSYGREAAFRLSVAGQPDGTEAKLFIRVNQSYTESSTTTFRQGSAVVTRDLKAAPLPPFAALDYWWSYANAEGRARETEHRQFAYLDDRYEWKSAQEAQVSIHWIAGDRAILEQALDSATGALDAITAALGAPQIDAAHIYVYPSQTDLVYAMQLGGHTWVGGVAYPELGVALVAAPATADGLLDLQRDIPHELTHLVLYRLLGPQGYAFLPTWLNEGLATHFETRPDPAYAQALDNALALNRLIPLADLCAPFPEEPLQARLAYAQSGSLVRFLRQERGWTAIRVLLQTYADGQSCQSGALRVLNQDLAELDGNWRQWLAREDGAGPETAPPRVDDAAILVREAVPWLMLLGLLVVPVAAFALAIALLKR